MQRVIERILNLLAFLLTVGRPVSADEIRHTVAGYHQETDEAFRRTFERDKDLLRGLGVPLKLEATDGWEVEHGYVVAPDEYSLPDPGLSDEERAAIWLALRMVRLGGQAPGTSAILKLGGAPAVAAGEPLTADLGSGADMLATLFSAVTERRRISFDYREKARTLEPYGLVHRMGHWYIVGSRVGDGDIRSFRVDRAGSLQVGERSDAFERPDGFKASTALPEAPWEAGGDDVEVRVSFDPSIGWWARHQLTGRATTSEAADGSLEARFPVASVDAFIGWMIGFDDDAEVVGPPEVRERFLAHVEGQ